MIPEHLAAHFSPLEPIPTGMTPVLPDRGEFKALLFETTACGKKNPVSHAVAGKA